jgi:hypothetical protein
VIRHSPSVASSRAVPSRATSTALLFATAAAALFAGGCQSVSLPKLSLPGRESSKRFSPDNHVHAGAIPAHVRRVAVLPLHTDAWRAGEIATIDAALREALAGMERFELAPISRAELARRFHQETFESSSALPADFLAWLRTDFGADAVVFLDLTHYGPYQPVALGVRAKLVTCVEGDAIWSFDSLFDAADNEVAAAARRFSADGRRGAPAAEDNTGILQSPARFAKFVGHATFTTLPLRQTE